MHSSMRNGMHSSMRNGMHKQHESMQPINKCKQATYRLIQTHTGPLKGTATRTWAFMHAEPNQTSQTPMGRGSVRTPMTTLQSGRELERFGTGAGEGWTNEQNEHRSSQKWPDADDQSSRGPDRKDQSERGSDPRGSDPRDSKQRGPIRGARVEGINLRGTIQRVPIQRVSESKRPEQRKPSRRVLTNDEQGGRASNKSTDVNRGICECMSMQA
jgi:hypothetical protein